MTTVKAAAEDRARWNPEGLPEVTHQCPPEGSGVMPCCGRSPIGVPPYHRITLDPALVTCAGVEQEATP